MFSLIVSCCGPHYHDPTALTLLTLAGCAESRAPWSCDRRLGGAYCFTENLEHHNLKTLSICIPSI
jgi:hypothetical protein